LAKGIYLRDGHRRSCGCLRKEVRLGKGYPKKLVGNIFGRLKVLELVPGKRRHTNVVWLCQCECGNLKEAVSTDLLQGHTMSCGCLKISQATARLPRFHKENHPAWKGGITPEHELIRNSHRYMEWRTTVFERDGYMCLACLTSPSNQLIAHHIECFSEYPEKRFDTKNGATLCVCCHKNFHDLYGYTKNTINQFYYFTGKSFFHHAQKEVIPGNGG